MNLLESPKLRGLVFLLWTKQSAFSAETAYHVCTTLNLGHNIFNINFIQKFFGFFFPLKPILFWQLNKGKGLGHYYAITYAPVASDFCSYKEHYCLTATEFMEKAIFHQWQPCAFTFKGIHFPLVFIRKALCSKGQPAEIHNPLAHTKDIPRSPILFHVLGWSLRWDTIIFVLRCFISSLWFYYSPV